MSPTDLPRILLVCVLGLPDIKVDAGHESDELFVTLPTELPSSLGAPPDVLQGEPIRLIVCRVDEGFAATPHLIAERHARVVEVGRRYQRFANMKILAPILVHMDLGLEIAERHRKVVGVHQAAEQLLE